MLDAHTVVSTFGGSMSRDVEVYEPFQANKKWEEAEILRSTLMLHNRSVGQVAKKICVLRFWKDKEVTITYSMHSFKHSFIGMAFCICRDVIFHVGFHSLDSCSVNPDIFLF